MGEHESDFYERGWVLPITVERSDAECRVRLEEEINISVAAELKKILMQVLESEKQVRVDLEGATGMDVTGLQLLWAAGREARKSGVEFALVGKVPAEIAAVIAEVGLEEVGLLMAERPAAVD